MAPSPTVDKTRREEMRENLPSHMLENFFFFFFFNQLNMRNLILYANSQFVFFCCFCTLRVLYRQIKTDFQIKTHIGKQIGRNVDVVEEGAAETESL